MIPWSGGDSKMFRGRPGLLREAVAFRKKTEFALTILYHFSYNGIRRDFLTYMR